MIVALFARGRDLSYAVFHEGELVRFGMKSIRGKRRGARFRRAVTDAVAPLLEIASSPVIVIEPVDDTSRLGALPRTLACLPNHGPRKRGVRFVSLRDAKARWCGNPRATHRELRDAMFSRHAVLHACPPSTALGISLAVALGETAQAI